MVRNLKLPQCKYTSHINIVSKIEYKIPDYKATQNVMAVQQAIDQMEDEQPEEIVAYLIMNFPADMLTHYDYICGSVKPKDQYGRTKMSTATSSDYVSNFLIISFLHFTKYPTYLKLDMSFF